MQYAARLAGYLYAPEVNDRLGFRHLGQYQMLPAALFKQVASQVILVQSLHHQHHHAILLVIQAGAIGLVEPCIRTLALHFGKRLHRIHGVIHNQEVPALAND